ncbi:TPA: aminotransferase class I/II-fold pyridoxal phosphate-dependent enzyme, partial [Candidatus Poribacteria bacterium]|nr:aminotransferase class I/II-fold pyridoxal phosphate-dependent enzyme [Candidatus Poribacteria bacterium]
MEIPLARPDITEREIEAVVKVLQTPNLSLGPKLAEFEERIADYAGVRYAVAVNSGTSALHLIIKALGIGEGDEVITTPFSFIASANCILFERARPVFVDIDPKTLNIDPERIEERITGRTKAIVAVDVFGHPADWDRLEEIARRHNLKLIEDSAEALGAEYRGKRAGSF